jgi:hypothetical protein
VEEGWDLPDLPPCRSQHKRDAERGAFDFARAQRHADVRVVVTVPLTEQERHGAPSLISTIPIHPDGQFSCASSRHGLSGDTPKIE